MQLLSTAFLIYALVIAAKQVRVTAQQLHNYDEKTDQLAQEAKNRAVTIIDGPKYVASSSPPPASPPPPAAPAANHSLPDRRPPSKPPSLAPDKHGKQKYIEIPRQTIYISQIPPHLRSQYPAGTKLKVHSHNSGYKYQKVIPLQPHRNSIHAPKQQLVFAASTSKPSIAAKSPKFSLPIETINGIRADFVRPPHFINSTASPTSTTTTAATSTTTRYLRTKRIWPKHILEKQNASNSTGNHTTSVTNKNNTDNDLSSSASKIRIVISDNSESGSAVSSTRAPYRRVTRAPKRKPTTPAPAEVSHFEPNDWVPIVPSHYPLKKVRNPKQTPISRRSDTSEVYFPDPNEAPNNKKRRTMYLQSFGLFPVSGAQSHTETAATTVRKNRYVSKAKPLKTHVYSGYRGKPVVHTINGDYQTDESDPMKIITRIKHHHHHHHHRYVKTVEKPVRVEVPKPVPVAVPMPVPVRVEQKVPYPVPVKVPHPVPVRVIQKEYVPKPYPVMQQVPVEVIKHVPVKVPHPVPVTVEKQIPYPVQVEVPVPKPYPVRVEVEKKVPYPVPVRVLVPQPYPVEKKVPVHVKEPVEVVKHVPVRVPVRVPYPVKVPHPVPFPVEKKVPYPVEVEKKVPLPVPYRVLVPEKVEVEKKVPVYVPRPYPVEKKVPYPVRIPYPVRVPIRVPVGIPIMVHPHPNQNNEQNQHLAENVGSNNQQLNSFSYSSVTSSPDQTVTVHGNQPDSINNIINSINSNTENPRQTVTVHGRPGFGFQSRVDVSVDSAESTASSSEKSTTTTESMINNIIRTITETPRPDSTPKVDFGFHSQVHFGFQSRSDVFVQPQLSNNSTETSINSPKELIITESNANTANENTNTTLDPR